MLFSKLVKQIDDDDDDDDSSFYVPFNIISVISRLWKGDNEKLCAMKPHSHELNFTSSGIQTPNLETN